jgi:hypothetical protein
MNVVYGADQILYLALVRFEEISKLVKIKGSDIFGLQSNK